jgi:hypothetical protein
VLVDTHTGEVINDEVVTNLWRTSLVRDEGRWKVASNDLVDEWTGVAGCAVE